MKKVKIEIEVKEWSLDSDNIKVGDLFLYEDEVLIFDGYEWSTPYAKNINSNETFPISKY